jgi:hypothetical protein
MVVCVTQRGLMHVEQALVDVSVGQACLSAETLVARAEISKGLVLTYTDKMENIEVTLRTLIMVQHSLKNAKLFSK